MALQLLGNLVHAGFHFREVVDQIPRRGCDDYDESPELEGGSMWGSLRPYLRPSQCTNTSFDGEIRFFLGMLYRW